MTVSAIVLAAGEGSRMRSSRPKPLHLICGRPMVMHVIHALEAVAPERTVVVVGHGAEQVTKKVQEQAPEWAHLTFTEQTVQRGTGDAAMVGLGAVPGDDLDDTSTVIVLPGDTPLLQPATIDALVAAHNANEYAATLITSVLDDPTGYGRVIRAPSKTGDGRVLRIIEQRDANAEQREVQEVCTSMYAFRRDLLGPALRHLSPDNAQGEYYLTDVIGSLAAMGHRIGCVQAPEAETQGVNDRWQLALAERELRSRTNRRWLLNGVTMLDPRQTFVDVTVQLGRDVTLYPGTILQGDTVVGDGCEIGPDTRLTDCSVGNGATVQNSVGVESEVGSSARVGPYAYLPSGSSVAPGAVTGAFYTAAAETDNDSDG
ncbi:MAG TPA: NTP transferase domain-containing protein [Ilumatobacteraceae bacterium]|nr:NTP transferase domain-containing protein [Ilumatobacteraceae bacterium]HRB02696.1 NTP transferase domain-containing protein [Ilumatobacteraceae bacterium]